MIVFFPYPCLHLPYWTIIRLIIILKIRERWKDKRLSIKNLITSSRYWMRKSRKKSVEQKWSSQTEIAPWKTGCALSRDGRAAGEISHRLCSGRNNLHRTKDGFNKLCLWKILFFTEWGKNYFTIGCTSHLSDTSCRWIPSRKSLPNITKRTV